uniref:Cytochrome b-c1 complex subunit 1, mitochondrial (inferred by orthology to a C. elegans protein) n=1 Tax=Nippostrongylus brasiliensis TaxID=27835 RepID=A0A0N4YY20_NIPBR
LGNQNVFCEKIGVIIQFRVVLRRGITTSICFLQVGVWIETGSRYETEQTNGVAHFLERLMHKGTGKRASTALENELEAIGARMKSYTTRDRTAVYVHSAAQDVEKGMDVGALIFKIDARIFVTFHVTVVDILADVLRNSKLDSSAIEAERAVLLRELEECEGDFQKVTMDNLHAAAFQGTSMAKSPLGTSESLKAITAKHLKEWQEDNYRPIRMVLSAVGGGCSGSKLQSLAEKYFSDLSNEYPRKVPEAGGIRFTGSEYRYRNDYIPHMYSAVAVEGVGYGHKDALALQMASQFIGQWDVTHATDRTAPSRWVQKISHDHGLHFLQHFNLNYKDTGLFGVYFISNGDDLANSQGIMRSIQHEWKLRTELYQNLETNTEKAEYNAKELLYTGGVRSLAQLEEEIANIDHNALRAAVFRNVSNGGVHELCTDTCSDVMVAIVV